MKRALVGIFVAAGAVTAPVVGVGAQQEVLEARILTAEVLPDGKPVIESVDVCLRSASSPQIGVLVTAPSGEVVIDQYHRPGLDEPGVTVDDAGNWSVELQLRDDDGQPTGEPFPELGTYLVEIDCVTTYQPTVRIPYNDLSFEVVDRLTPSTTAPTPPTPTPPAPADPTPPPAAPVVREPDFTG